MTQTNKYQGPLAGLNVIDFGHYYAGPMVGMLLADQGANVIRIVRPGEPELPSQQYRLLNRNKKLLTLDLKTEEGKTQALSLIEKADVVIENFRPGVMKRLGLDYTSVEEKNLGLVYLSLPGFSSTDKERSQIQAWEGILSAATGVFDARYYYQKLNFPPVYDSVPICSAAGGIQGAIAVMAALVAREENGFGTIIETPLVDAGLSVYSNFFPLHSLSGFMANVELPETLACLVFTPQEEPEEQLKKAEAAIEALPPAHFYQKYYPASDGRTMLIWPWQRPHQVEKLLKVLGIDTQVKREGFVNLGPWERGVDNNLSGNFHVPSGKMSQERIKRIMELISMALATRTAEEWEPLMEEAGVPFGVVRTQEEWLALEPMLKSGVNIKMDNGESVLTVPGRVADVDGPGGELINSYAEAQKVTATEVDQLLQKVSAHSPQGKRPTQKKGDLLNGLKVLDLCNIVAGPTATNTLAQYGAHIIKAEAVHELASVLDFMLEQNQGKRSIILDVKTAPGREVFEKLIRWADVVVHNIVDDTAKRLGICQEQLRVINPNIVSCQVTTFGGTYLCGWEKRAGYDQIAKVVTGMKTRFGTVDEPKGPPSEWIISDIMGGLCLSFSGLLAVYQQRKTGYAGKGRASLVQGNNYIYLPHMIAENGRSSGEGHTRLDKGEYWWQRLYQCSDGWIYVGTSEDRAGILAEKVTGKTSTDDKLMEVAFAGQIYSHWQGKLDEVNIACHRVLTLNDLIEESEARNAVQKVSNEAADETAKGNIRFLSYQDHPCGKPITTIAPTWVRIGEEYSYHRLTPAPRLGEHTREILRELGYTEDEVAELIRLKVAHEYLPRMGSKSAYFFEPEDN